jgi:hypothetical protein
LVAQKITMLAENGIDQAKEFTLDVCQSVQGVLE